jgi:CRISPR-associated endonuclease/helicase Cas3
MTDFDFDQYFERLTTHRHFPWQRRLFDELIQKQFRKTCDIPTGLGKTSVITVWLLALAYHARNGSLNDFPRRLVYVVNRRTVVDQATREAERLREALVFEVELNPIADALRALCVQPESEPLAISTLRGQFADNAEWRNDPARAAIIVGTVDMIGSRLLFAGYGRGFKTKPLHAGFLGQDVLLVHDEAHLEPAFQELIRAICSEQERRREFAVFRVMELTATSRTAQPREEPLFTEADCRDSRVKERFEARKGIVFHSVEDEKGIPDKIAGLALEHKDSGQAIIVFLRKLDDIDKVVDRLRRNKQNVQVLTGTLRGLERDELAKRDIIFARFMPKSEITPQSGTVYLVCTSAGEVGVDISADHMACDLTPFDSMAQRFGRVNRFGGGDARIDIVHFFKEKASAPGLEELRTDQDLVASTRGDGDNVAVENQSKGKDKVESPFEQAGKKTLSLLHKLPLRNDVHHDGSPVALRELPVDERQAAFTPLPVIRPASDILFDSWALTSVREKLPGRPPVADWLHGVADWEPPETFVAWRDEVGILTGSLLDGYDPQDLLDDYPLKPQELLRDRTDRVVGHLEKIAEREPDLPFWQIEPDGELRVLTMSELVKKGKGTRPAIDLKDCTVLLPPRAGGLRKGMLDGDESFDETHYDRYDVSGTWQDEDGRMRRCRVWNGEPPPDGMRLVRTIDVLPDAEDVTEENEQPGRRYWHWYVRPRSADDDGSRTARVAQDLLAHLEAAKQIAHDLVIKLELPEQEATAVRLAAKWHDLGKNRAVWQRSIGNGNYPQQVLAKSGPGMRPIDITRYRHEFGSLIDVFDCAEFRELRPDVQDLVLHLIAAHHGRARPHFPGDEAFDSDHPEEIAAEIVREVPRRFARLQRKYGRWGLAYLESLVRAADALASQAIRSEPKSFVAAHADSEEDRAR